MFYDIKLDKITILNIASELNKVSRDDNSSEPLQKIIKIISSLHEKLNIYYGSLKSNSVLLQKMLDSHKRSVNFWEDYAAKLVASYNQKGEKKISKKNSQLSIKA